MSHLTLPPPDASPTTLAAPPGLSAAEALASTPFFSELSAVDLARLVPELEEHDLMPGEVVFHQGDPGDGFYLIRSGTVEAVVTEAGGTQVVTRLAAPAHFGEGALLTDELRSSTVTAIRSEEHTSELQSRQYLVCRLLLEKKKIYSLLLDQLKSHLPI